MLQNNVCSPHARTPSKQITNSTASLIYTLQRLRMGIHYYLYFKWTNYSHTHFIWQERLKYTNVGYCNKKCILLLQQLLKARTQLVQLVSAYPPSRALRKLTPSYQMFKLFQVTSTFEPNQESSSSFCNCHHLWARPEYTGPAIICILFQLSLIVECNAQFRWMTAWQYKSVVRAYIMWNVYCI